LEEFKMKKLLALILAALMLVSVVGCGGASADKGTLKIGGIGPITGAAAIYGQAVKNAMEMAVAEVNAKGGIQFEMNFQDDAHVAETSVNAYGTLMDWGMQILVGSVTSGPAAAVSAEAAADRIFVLTPSASSPKVIEGHTNVYQMCFSDPNQGIASADYIATNKLSEKVAVIYQNDSDYSTGIYEKFKSEADAKGLNIVYTGTFTEDSATDFSVQLTSAKAAGADMLFLPIYYTPISMIMTQADTMGYAVKYFGVDGMDGLLGVENFNTALAEGAYLLTPFSADATDDKTVAFVKAYQEKYGEVPNQFAADAYDCIWALYEACTAAKIDPANISTTDLCAKMIEQFTSFKFNGLTGQGMTWAASGEVAKSPMAVVIKDGVYTSVQ
jgi:branched-chain amino acid transport system substrate-binding protein